MDPMGRLVGRKKPVASLKLRLQEKLEIPKFRCGTGNCEHLGEVKGRKGLGVFEK